MASPVPSIKLHIKSSIQGETDPRLELDTDIEITVTSHLGALFASSPRTEAVAILIREDTGKRTNTYTRIIEPREES